MMSHPSKALHTFILCAFLLVPTATALAHSGHASPEVHAHAGSPSLLVVFAIIVLGIAALVPLARLTVHLRRRHHQR
jgi:cytochrome c biogenesis factor